MVDEIQTYSTQIIKSTYLEFLLQNHDQEDREYPENIDQIQEVLIHANYLSKKDIEIGARTNLSLIANHQNFSDIYKLHESLRSEYGSYD